MDKNTKRIIQKIQQKSDEVNKTKGNSWDDGYIFGLEKAISIIERDYIHNSKDKSTKEYTPGSMFRYENPNDVINGKF